MKVRKGEISQKTFDEWEAATHGKLPKKLKKRAFWHGFTKAADDGFSTQDKGIIQGEASPAIKY